MSQNLDLGMQLAQTRTGRKSA
ncbi:hypothetical protein CORC01_06212 [Colletotrichum orchidophilum]|uniref:Uncharacterized protein n=1 Tax=Colletotrichum orchidophilum TaxID=1209926 RepID=A0A1G4BAI3_9PEZI|nr:hypothetical protein CORC01_06212 [Colletotrichum orchidophilum]